MQHARRKRFGRRIGRSEAEHVGVADRLGAHAGAHRIADHAADARVRTTVRLQSRRMVVRFDFETDVILFVEANYAGVVRKNADAPILVAGILTDLLCGGENGFLQHVLEGALAIFVAIANPPGQCFVAAMFAPRLGDRF